MADDRRALERATMTVPHYIGENESDMCGIKCGWCAIEDDDDLSAGDFSNREKCVGKITKPPDVTGAATLQDYCTRLALLWQIIRGTGFPNQIFSDSWVVGLMEGRPWRTRGQVGNASLGDGSGLS